MKRPLNSAGGAPSTDLAHLTSLLDCAEQVKVEGFPITPDSPATQPQSEIWVRGDLAIRPDTQLNYFLVGYERLVVSRDYRISAVVCGLNGEALSPFERFGARNSVARFYAREGFALIQVLSHGFLGRPIVRASRHRLVIEPKELRVQRTQFAFGHDDIDVVGEPFTTAFNAAMAKLNGAQGLQYVR